MVFQHPSHLLCLYISGTQVAENTVPLLTRVPECHFSLRSITLKEIGEEGGMVVEDDFDVVEVAWVFGGEVGEGDGSGDAFGDDLDLMGSGVL